MSLTTIFIQQNIYILYIYIPINNIADQVLQTVQQLYKTNINLDRNARSMVGGTMDGKSAGQIEGLGEGRFRV